MLLHKSAAVDRSFSVRSRNATERCIDNYVNGLGKAFIRSAGSEEGSRSKPNRSVKAKKQADFFNSPNISELERAFEEIAEQKVLDRVRGLEPYWIGFQMLKKTENESRACGIFAFKAGEELIYIPAFILNGEVIGYELMYIVSRDQFVPSDEKWINYLLSRKPVSPLRIQNKERSEILQPMSYRPDTYTSGLKLSSVRTIPRLPKPMLDHALKVLFKEAALTAVQDTPRFKYAMGGMNLDNLFRESARASKLASLWSNEYPVFDRLMKGVLEGDVHSYIKEWQKRAAFAKSIGIVASKPKTLSEYLRENTKQAAAPVWEVSVKTAEEIPLHQYRFLKPEDIDLIHKKGYYVCDTRDQSKLAGLAVAKESSDLSSPGQPGVYNVFTADGKFSPCVVLRDNDPLSYEDEIDSLRRVIEIGSGRTVRAKNNEILVEEGSFDPDWKERLPEDKPPKKSEKSEDECYPSYYRDDFLITPSGYAWNGRFEESGKDAFQGDHGTKITLLPNSLSQFESITPLDYDNDSIVGPKGAFKKVYDTSNENRLSLGTMILWTTLLMDNTLPVRIRKRDKPSGQYAVDGLPEMSKAAALQTLMLNHHLSQKSAEFILESADESAPYPVKYLRTKSAYSMPLDEKFTPPFPEKTIGSHDITGMPLDEELDADIPMENTSERKQRDPMEFYPATIDVDEANPPQPNQRDIEMASEAARMGQKEFVSSQMLMSLLREIDEDGLITKYVAVFEKACDAMGRLYIQVLWHHDTFEERFGRDQLKEFRSTIVSLFQQLGDFICYLRQRDVKPAPVLSYGALETGSPETEEAD